MRKGVGGSIARAWPAVTTERLPWEPSTSFALPSGRARRQAGPYQAAIPADIAGVADVPLTPSTRALATEAATEIARFDQEVGADLAPFSSILLRTESVASSRI